MWIHFFGTLVFLIQLRFGLRRQGWWQYLLPFTLCSPPATAAAVSIQMSPLLPPSQLLLLQLLLYPQILESQNFSPQRDIHFTNKEPEDQDDLEFENWPESQTRRLPSRALTTPSHGSIAPWGPRDISTRGKPDDHHQLNQLEDRASSAK